MKSTVLNTLLVVGFVAGLSCAHVIPVVSCAEPLVVQVIENDLSGSDWESKIGKDLGAYGPGVVDCVVNQILAMAESDKTSTSAMVEHARAYKAKRAAGAI